MPSSLGPLFGNPNLIIADTKESHSGKRIGKRGKKYG
jgi:hypothetical protein